MGELRAMILRFLRNAAFVIAGLLVLLLLTYGVLVIRWQTGSAQINRNIAAEIISRTSAQAGDAPAWPGVVAALDATSDFEFTPMDRFHPSHPRWDEWMAHVSANATEIRAIREALEPEHLGVLPSLVSLSPEGWVYHDPAAPDVPIILEYSLDLLEPMYEISSDARAIRSLLILDAWRAAEVDDAETAVEDLIAALRLAGQLHETSFLIDDLVAIGSYIMVCRAVSWILEDHPDLFAADQFRQIRAASDAFMGGDPQPALDDEVLVAVDIEQRIYTDNGKGGGRVIVNFASEDFDPWPSPGRRRWAWADPIWQVIAPSRAEFREMTKRCYEALRQDARDPSWPTRKSNQMQLLNELDSTRLKEQRWSYHASLLLGTSRVPNAFANVRLHQRGLRVALAAAEWRSMHGRWPDSLDDCLPSMLERVPDDPFSEGLMLYRIDEDSGAPVIYSAGGNGVDDGGSQEPGANSWFDPDVTLDLVVYPFAPPEPETDPFGDDDAIEDGDQFGDDARES